jgi:hypothetical protein
MFRYRLHLEDGSDAGEATYAQMIRPDVRLAARSLLRYSRQFTRSTPLRGKERA